MRKDGVDDITLSVVNSMPFMTKQEAMKKAKEYLDRLDNGEFDLWLLKTATELSEKYHFTFDDLKKVKK